MNITAVASGFYDDPSPRMQHCWQILPDYPYNPTYPSPWYPGWAPQPMPQIITMPITANHDQMRIDALEARVNQLERMVRQRRRRARLARKRVRDA